MHLARILQFGRGHACLSSHNLLLENHLRMILTSVA